MGAKGGGEEGVAATRPAHLGELLLVESARDRHRGSWSDGCCSGWLSSERGTRRKGGNTISGLRRKNQRSKLALLKLGAVFCSWLRHRVPG